MLKKIAVEMLARLGYRISKIDPGNSLDIPFQAMKDMIGEKSDLIIFDVGAHHGLTAREFRAFFPASCIHCFEPFPESFEILARTTSSDSFIINHNFGISNENKKLAFHSNESSATNSILSTDSRGSMTWGKGLLETKEIVQADFRSLDSFAQEYSIPHINILKLDVQGAEHLVLEGARSLCEQKMIDLIYMEIIIQPTYKRQRRLDEVLAYLNDIGFDLFNFYHPCFTPAGRLCQVDAIFTQSTS